MSRQQRSEHVVSGIAGRFVRAAQADLGLKPADLWRLLGYANSTTIQAVRQGKSLPDFVRIAEHFAQLKDKGGRSLNLHWVITGEGRPFIEEKIRADPKIKANEQFEHDIIIKLRRMKPGKRVALMKFLEEFS